VELARREKEIADTEATLRLLEAGTRSEEIDAERSRLARLEAEGRFFAQQKQTSAVHTPVAGLVTTSRLKEKVGQYLEKGTLICLIEDFDNVEAELSVPE